MRMKNGGRRKETGRMGQHEDGLIYSIYEDNIFKCIHSIYRIVIVEYFMKIH